ncbi:MAG: biotin/lipoyl-containing protein [Deltaproteobacteria bacterium]|nr:biotin/lipoyl-containing protein [Deltaproteobacteria bacterium]
MGYPQELAALGRETIMAYQLKIGNKTVAVDVAQGTDDRDFRFMVEDRAYDVRCRVIDDTLIRLRINGTWHHLFLVKNGDVTEVFLKGNIFRVQDLDEIPVRRGRPGMGDDSPGEITPPMPAIVVKILVQEGDKVQKGQGLVVVSAMKMETTLSAPRNGVISRINTSVDARVAPGDTLVEMEAEEPFHE